MQKLAEISIRRPVFATMLIMALVVTGTAAYFQLNVDRTPQVDIPTIYVSTTLPGASPVEMESLVAQRVEENVNTVEGIDELRSISGVGRSFTIIRFNLDRDPNEAAEDVRSRISAALPELPPDADPPRVTKFDTESSPVLGLALAGDRSVRELTEFAERIVKVQLERSYGVGEVEVFGGLSRAINVWVDADRLAAYQIPITEVRNAIARQNANVPGGNVTNPKQEQTLRTLGRMTSAKEFDQLVITTINGTPVRVRDIGWAEDGTKEQRSAARLNGKTTVSLDVRRQSGANTVEVIDSLKAKLPAIQSLLPSDVKLEIIRDQSRYIHEALHEIKVHLVLGSILASLVVLVFMRSWRSTLIAAVAIPASVISTFGMMWALDFTLNSVTMLALVLMVGIVIDDAIVVLENIFRFVEEKGMAPFEAAKAATEEIGLAVLATTLSLVVIFVPVSFMSSVAGRFLFQFGLTAAVAVMVSLLVSFTLTPMMAARMLRAKKLANVNTSSHLGTEITSSRRGFYAWIDRSYLRSLAWSMHHRWIIFIIAIGVMFSSLPLYKKVQQEFTPGNTDEGEFEVSVTAREGTGLVVMHQVMKSIEGELTTIPTIRMMVVSSGASGGPSSSPNSGRIFIQLTPHQERLFSFSKLFSKDPLSAFRNHVTQRDVMQEIRKKLRKFSQVRIGVRNPSSSISLGGPNYDIDFAIMGPDLDQLSVYAEALREQGPQIGLQDLDTSLKLDKPELRVQIDRERAAALGVDTQDIASALRIMVGGDPRVSRFRDNTVNEDYDVQLRLAERDRTDSHSIARLYVPKRGGGLVRLDNVVQIVRGQTASRIDRMDRQRTISVRGGIAPGYALADRIKALRDAADKLNMPPAYTTKISGRGRELESTFSEFLWAFLLSIIFMYMILASQYESLIHPVTILLSLPLSLPFALLSLWATGNTMNLYSALGLLVLFGVVKKNAILQIDHMNYLRRQGMERSQAILQANRDRLRPILMTTLALVAGMLPLAVGAGPGAEERRAVAVVVIGGQSLCLLLTLLVTPVAYSYLDDVGAWIKARSFGKGLDADGRDVQPQAPTA